MKNLLDSTQIATIFLDVDLAIRRFTPKAVELIPLSDADIGRPIYHFATELKKVKLVEYAKKVLKDLAMAEEEVQTHDNRFFKMRILPYRTIQNLIDGVVITFEDITRIKINEQKLRRLATVITDSNDAITLQDFNGNIVAWNKGAQNMYGYTENEALKMNVFDMIPEEKKQETRTLMGRLKKGEPTGTVNTLRRTKDGKVIDILLVVTVLKDTDGQPEGIATTEKHISPA